MKISTGLVKGVFGVLGILILLHPLTVPAQTKVVVIPLPGDDMKPLKNIITVAKANGNFADPVAALNSITDASSSNPYLVVIGPGIYNISKTLEMKAYIDILGSGENITSLVGAISTKTKNASSAIVAGADNSGLSSLTVRNKGGSAYSIGIYNGNASPKLRNVTIEASGGTDNYGVYNLSSHPIMTDVTAEAYGGQGNTGVCNEASSPMMTGGTALAHGGDYNMGVWNKSSSSVTMTGITALAHTGRFNFAVRIYDLSSVKMTNVTATAYGGEEIYAVSFSGPSNVIQAIITRSTLSGPVSVEEPASYPSTVQAKCIFCDDGNGNSRTCN